MSNAVMEMVTDEVISEFRGAVPDVPLREGVDLAELTAGDSDPFLLTVQVSNVGRVSRNGLLHDDELADALVRQINAQGVEGIMGHIKETERSTAYPVSDVHWLGAVRQGAAVWAKGYIPKTATAQREHFRILKATRGRAATSITGPAVREFVDKGKGVWRAKDFQLEQLDLAPFTRAALPPDQDFVITREMERDASYREEQDMTKAELIAELTVEDVPSALREALTQEMRDGIAARDTRIAELEQAADVLTQVRETLALDADADVHAVIAEMQQRAAAEAQAAIARRITELAATNVKVEAVRALVVELVETRKPTSIDEAEAAFEAVMASENVKRLLAAQVRETMGPPAVVAGKVRGPRTIEDTPENRRKARKQFTF